MIKLRLDVNGETREYAFRRTEITIGRSPLNNLSVAAESVSARHGRLHLDAAQGWSYEDLDSIHGTTLLRGSRALPIRTLQRLNEGDVLLLGRSSVRLEMLNTTARPSLPDALRHQAFSPETPDLSLLSPGLVRRVAELALEAAAGIDANTLAERCAAILSEALGQPITNCGVLHHGGGPWRLMMPGPEGNFQVTPIPLNFEQRERLAMFIQQPGLITHTHQRGLRLGVAAFSAPDPHAVTLIFETSRVTDDAAMGRALEVAKTFAPLMRAVAATHTAHDQFESVRAENRYFRERQRRHYLFKELVTESPAMRDVYKRLGELVETPGPVVLIGDAGTGKELIARAVHHLSERSDHLMASLHCASHDTQLLNLELFGSGESVSGQSQLGIFELADGGTVFLSDVDHLPALLQSSLLRVIKEGEVRRHGEGEARHVNVRLVLSTHHTLAEIVAQGRLRRDLHAFLKERTLRVPPLRDRDEDILPLVRIFLEIFARRYDVDVPDLSTKALDKLVTHRWPGNVRELQTVVEAALLRSQGHMLRPEHFGFIE